MPLIEVRSLRAGYGRIQVIAGVDIELDRGQCIALLGPNGAGKSTLLKAMSGSLAAVSGSVRIDGKEYTGKPAHKILAAGLALVPEGRHVFPRLSVADNLLLGSLRLRDRRKALAARTDTVLELFPRLRERAGQMAGTLSGGEQQMLAIGRALMANPRAMLLDEPFMGLAPLVIDEIIKAIRVLAAAGVGLIIVEQKSDQVLNLCSHVFVMAKGAIVVNAPAAELRNSSSVMDAYFGTLR